MNLIVFAVFLLRSLQAFLTSAIILPQFNHLISEVSIGLAVLQRELVHARGDASHGALVADLNSLGITSTTVTGLLVINRIIHRPSQPATAGNVPAIPTFGIGLGRELHLVVAVPALRGLGVTQLLWGSLDDRDHRLNLISQHDSISEVFNPILRSNNGIIQRIGHNNVCLFPGLARGPTHEPPTDRLLNALEQGCVAFSEASRRIFAVEHHSAGVSVYVEPCERSRVELRDYVLGCFFSLAQYSFA